MEKIKIEFEAKVFGSYDTIVCGGAAGTAAAQLSKTDGAARGIDVQELRETQKTTVLNAEIKMGLSH